MTYRPPFVSERVGDDVPFQDCTYAAGMMALASWTFGEATSNGPFRWTLDSWPTCATSFAPTEPVVRTRSTCKAVQKKFPDLPHMPSWDNPAALLRIDFPTWKKRIQKDQCGILQGNPVKVTDHDSPTPQVRAGRGPCDLRRSLPGPRHGARP